MTTVTIVRRQDRFRRSINGAWLSNGTALETLERDEDVLRPKPYQHPLYGQMYHKFGLASGITVTWPDGVVEHAFPGNRGVGDYPPECIPRDGRLAKLLNF